MAQLAKIMKKHTVFLVIIAIIYLLSAITVIFTPRGFEVPQLENTYVLFGPSLAALILLISIGGYLTYRYYNKPQPRIESRYQLIWGLSFLIYCLTFIGLCLQALGIDLAYMDDPMIFFIWRNPMIFWVTGMLIGTMMLFTKSKKAIYIPAIVIFLAGELWFVYRLIVFTGDTAIAIEQTMYGFLFGEFIPVSILIAYLFYTYGKDLNLSSARILTIGFALLALTYAAWAPWHFRTPVDLTYMYFIWFDLFLVALAFIFTGFFALPKEITSKVLTQN